MSGAPSRKPSFVRKPSERKEVEPDGLSQPEAEQLLLKYGRNELPRKKTPKILVFLGILAQPMPIMIWIAVIIELAIQDWLDAGILLIIQFANAGIAFYETTKAEDAVSALEGKMQPRTTVKRDGRWKDMESALLVIGDVVRLKAGAAIPADCEVLMGNIDVDQSTLNGESLPKNMVAGAEALMGTTVQRGEAVAIVRKTGADTSIGTTAALLKDTGELSNLQKTMNAIMIVLVVVSITLCVIVLIDLLVERHIGVSEALSFVVVLLVASVPLAIEIVTTTTLALGSRELSDHGAIVSRLTAIEDLSAMSILCSDKTGTLTMNKMKLQHQETVCYDMEDAAEEIALYDSFVPFYEAGNLGEVAKPEAVSLSINTDSAAAALPSPASPLSATFHRQPLIPDEVSRTSSKNQSSSSPTAAGGAGQHVEMQNMQGAASSFPVPTYHTHLVRLGSLCIKWNEHEHEPLDTMMVNCLSPTEIAYMNHFYDQIEFFPFDPAIKRVSAKIQECDTGNIFTVTKGAVEVLLKLVNNSAVSNLVLQDVYELGLRGIRAIGVATKQEPNGRWMMRGILPFLDPPREDTQATLDEAARKGVAVKMITGDSVLIARETARVLGLCTRPNQPCVVASNKLPTLIGQEKKVPEGLARDYGDMCMAADGFGGVIPEHKFLIVQCLRDMGYRVGMTGDGVNDAPALKQADVGIAVEGAVAAAQKAAQIVLTRPGLSTIIVGIVTARRIFRRINNFFIYRISATLQLILFFFISVFLFIPTDYQVKNPCYNLNNPSLAGNDYYSTFPCVCSGQNTTIGGGIDASRGCFSEGDWPPFFHLPVLMLMLITVLNDGTLISIGYDIVKERDIPERWNLKALFAISTLLAGVACVSSLLLLWMSLDSWNPNGVYQKVGIGEITFAQVATSLYLKVSISDFLTLFSARTGGAPFWSTRPSPILVTGGAIALSISSILSCTWPDSTTDGVLVIGLAYRSPEWLAVFIWIYCIVFWFIQDACKVLLSYLMTKYNWFGVNDTGTFKLGDSAIRYRDAVLDNVAQLEATVEIKEHGGGHGQAPHSVPLNIAARPQSISGPNPLEFDREEEGEEEDDAPLDRTVSQKAVRKSFSVAHIRKLNAMTPPRSRKPTLALQPE